MILELEDFQQVRLASRVHNGFKLEAEALELSGDSLLLERQEVREIFVAVEVAKVKLSHQVFLGSNDVFLLNLPDGEEVRFKVKDDVVVVQILFVFHDENPGVVPGITNKDSASLA